MNQVLLSFKKISREISEYDSCKSEIITTCLRNNHDRNFITQLNQAAYSGPLFDKKNYNLYLFFFLHLILLFHLQTIYLLYLFYFFLVCYFKNHLYSSMY